MKLIHALAGVLFLVGCESNDLDSVITITSISPDSGPFGTQVTISGTGFLETSLVTVNGVSASVIDKTPTYVMIKIPARAGTGIVSVATTTNTFNGPTFNFTYTVTVSTLAGQTGLPGDVIGDPSVSQFNLPSEIKIDPDDGFIYVSDRLNHSIKRITHEGTTSLYSGQSNNPGSTDGDLSTATYVGPNGIGFDKNGSAYLADVSGAKIRKITSSGTVSTFSGTGIPGFVTGAASVSQFDGPEDCVVDADLNVYVTEFGNHTIRKLSPSGASIVLAGDGTPGFADGTADAARFSNPVGIAIALDGSLVVADYGNHSIRKITEGAVTTIAGNGSPGMADGPVATATFANPRDVAIDSYGNIYIVDSSNHAIRLLTKSGTVITLAGNGTAGSTDGPGENARFNNPFALDVTTDGEVVYVADRDNHTIRKLIVK